MMAFFRQLQLLLWKNGLGIIRRPVWSVTLVLWPVVIFIIIAVTRHQFPPVLRSSCYVGPRNLPSTGFFPFLETIMCNTDSDCHNTSRMTHSKQPSRAKRSTRPSEDSPLSTLTKGIDLMQHVDTDKDLSVFLNSLYSFVGFPSRQPAVPHYQTSTGDKEMKNLTETAEMFKSALCTLALPLVQAPSPLVTFCESDNTVLEVVLKTGAQVISELQPDELAEVAVILVKVFEQLQNESSLWESLQSLPHMFNPTSPEHLLANLGKLLINLRKILYIMEHNFPEIKSVTSSVHPVLVAGIKIAEYIQHWPGKNASIRFGDVMTCNESLWQMFSNIEISLDKAIFLAVDKNMARDFVCKNSTGLTWMACASESVDMVLGCISPNKLVQQTLLAWSKFVAQHDLIFVKGMLHSLVGIFEGSGTSRTTRSIDAQPQNIEEELFLEVGKVVMEIVQLSPEAEAIVHDFLRVGFHSMKIGTGAMVPVQEIVENVVKDVTTIKMIVLTLMSDQPQTTIWISKALDSALELIKTPDPVTCDTILDEFEWVFSIKTIKQEVVRSFLCGNTTTIEQTLLKDWMPLVENAVQLNGIFMGNAKFNVTLPMVLSEWHTLLSKGLGFEGFLLKLDEDWSGEYWMDWMSENSSANHLPSSLQQSVWLFMVKLGQWFEQNQFWPEAKNYFHMAHWILNSTDTSQPNCNMNMKTFGIECDTDFDWDRFSHVLTTLLSPTEEVFISCLRRSVRVLQHVYSDLYKRLAASNLQNAIQGGEPLSAFLLNMLNQVDDFARTLTTLPDQSFSDPQVMGTLYDSLLKSIGLKPLLPLIMHNGPVNVSQVLEVVSELGRSNQGIFTFNESDPTMANLEKNIMYFLSMEGNFSFSIHLSMSQSLLTYYSNFSPEEVAKLKQAIQPFTNQTSSGIVEAILSSLDLLRTIIDAPSGDPTHAILGYIRQLQQLLGSLFQMQRIEQIGLPNGQMTPAQVTDLHLLSDIFDLLTPEVIMNLTKAGPVAAQHMIIQKYIQTLPSELRQESADFLDKFVALQSELAKCESDQGCLSGISEMLDFLHQILDMARSANGNATINIAATRMYMGSTQVMPVAQELFSLLLKPEDAAYVETVQEVLQFVSILLSHPDVTLSNVQEALQQANLTIEELNELVMWLGAKDINDLLEKVTQLQNAQKCFEQISPVSVAHCAVGLVNTISGLLMRLPALQNHQSILSTIPMIVNKTVTDMINTNFTSNPQNAAAETLKATLDSVKLSLQLNNMSTPEIQNEMEVFERLISLVGNPEPLKYLNVTPDELYTGVLKLISWYLDPLKNMTSSSSVSHLLEPFYDITRMQVALQLAQMDLIQFITEQVSNLTNSPNHQIDAEGVVKIGQTTIAILQHVLKFVEDNLEAQNAPTVIFGYDPPINMTSVNATMMQINNYINLLQLWMSQANFGAWGNLNTTSVVEKDIYHLIQSNLHFFDVDQQGYMRAIGNITHALNNALMSAIQPGGLQSEQFSEALLEAVQSAMDLFIQINGPLPLRNQQSVLKVIQNAVWLAAHPEASYAMSLNATLHILQNLRFLIIQIFSEELAQYPVCALEITTTYFESVITGSGPDSVNQLILKEMKTVESCLPPNSTAQHYISTIIKVTKSILQPSQCHQSLWSLTLSEENIPCISAEVVNVLNMLCPLFMGGSCEPFGGFADLPSILEKLTTGEAGNESTGMPLSVEQSVLTVIKNAMWLAAQPEASYATSLNATLHILQNLRFLIIQIFSEELAQYPICALEITTTYFESVRTGSGPDSVNQLILNEMKTVESCLPPNSTAQYYISTVIKVTNAILQPGQCHQSLWSLTLSEENIPCISAEVVKVLNMLCPLFMGGSCEPFGGFADLPSILEKLTTGQAGNESTGMPLSVEQSVLMVIKNAMWLAAQPEASYATSLNATLHILQNLHFLIIEMFSEELAQYPVCALEITTTYFESVRTGSGPDSVNQLILNEMKTVESCLPPNSTAQHYISAVIKVTNAILQPGQCHQSLWSLTLSEENIPCISAEVVNVLNMLCPLFMGESCTSFGGFANLPSILEKLPTGQAGNESTGMPLHVEQSVLTVIKNAMWLAAQPEASYATSLNATIDMLQNLHFLIIHIIPQEYTQYPLLVMDLIITYFESVASVSGPDGVNQLILNEMKTLERSLPPNIAKQLYISTVINITKAILQPGQGNRSLLSIDPSEENIPYIFAEVVKVVDMLCPLFMSCKPLGGFADLPHVLELLMTGQAGNETWRRLQEFVGVLLSFLEPEMSHNDLACFVEMFEKLIGDQVNRTKVQTGLILSLQTPVMMMITNMTQSLNNGHFNMSEVSERLEVAIEHTIKNCDETNGTMTCQDVLILWEPVREAAGLSPSFMAMWCSISLQPVIDGYANDITQYTQQNWTCAEQGPLSAEAAAARMVMTLRSLYHNEMKQSHVNAQFIQALSAWFFALVQQPLSPEAQLNLSKQLQQWQIQSSLQSMRLLSNQLHNEFPFLKPYMDAVEKMVTHILNNDQLMEGSDNIFNEVAMILLSSINIPSNDTSQIMSGTFSSKAWVNMALKAMQAMIDMKVFGDNPTLYHTLDQIVASNDTRMVMHKVAEMVSWLTSTDAKGLDLVAQTLTKVQDLLGSLLSVLTNMTNDLPPYLKVLHNLISDAISFIQQLLTSGSMPMANNYSMRQAMLSHNGSKIRRRREASYMPESPHLPKRSPMDDFIDLFYIDYDTLLISMGKTPTSFEILEMFHVLFANPDLETVLKETTKDLDWGLDISKKETIDAVLEVASLLTIPGMDYSSLALWEDVVNLLPDGFPYASLLKNVTRAITRESRENQQLMLETLDTVSALFQTDWTDPQLLEQLKQLRKQVCHLEKTDTLQTLMWGLSLEPGILCNGVVPGVYVLTEGLLNMSTLLEDLFEVFVGDPKQYKIQTDWTPMITHVLGFDITNLTALNFTSAAPVVTIGEMMRNKTAFMLDMQKLDFDPAVVALLTEAALPDNNLVLLSWAFDLRKCGSKDLNKMGPSEKALRDSFCSMNATAWYSFTVLMAQHLNTEKVIYKMMLPTEVQRLVQSMLEMASSIMNIMQTMAPLIRKLADYLPSIEDLSLEANNQFHQMARHQRTAISSGATFVTISRALCSNGILALFGVAKNPHVVIAPPTFDNNPKREEMIERFKIPKNATPFCTNMYLDMVNTTGGAIAWAFLKPMLMGQILFTPNTPQTRAIMNKANSTLQQLADLRHYSRDWIKSSNYIVDSSEMLTQTLPLLQNSLGNSFVKNFIEMQTGINVDSMQETLNNFSNMTVLLEKNKDLLGQITTLSTLMVDLSSCITFDRHRGYDTEDELNRVAQDLAKNRDLYASVIFKLPKDTDSSRKRRSASSEITLPPKVRYTIRMHMDNVMRTDRARQPFYSKETHISAALTLRYNRGFIYLQETIDRAIIDIQANKTVTDTAVQIQPFPYPCHHRDEYLEAISFVFPLLLMIAWVLFVADFVKKLVHEREMKLHEYMKMMGVSPFSHFFAWFLESAFYLVLTIFILTLVLKCGNILPHSNGFLLFLYLCDYGLSILAFSFLISTFFDKTYIAALSGSLLYVLAFFPFIAVMALETHISFSVKSLLGLFSPTAFSYASQYISRYETQGEGIQWSNSYFSPIAGDTASFGWLCWLMLIDTFLYFIIGAYIRTVFPGKSGIPSPWYFPFKASFWKDLCGCRKSKSTGRGLFLTNILQTQPPVFPDSDGKGKGKGDLSSKTSQNFSDLPVGVALYGLTKVYGRKAAIENLNLAFYEGHVTSLLGHNGAGKTTTMSILTGLFPPSSGVVEVYGRDMQVNLEEIRQELGVCMQYDVLFDHMTAKEHLLLYGQIKAPHWSKRELQEQVRMILEETGMYAHRHKRVGTLSGGMKRKLSISIAFIGGSRLVVLDEPTTGVDPCSRRSIWDIVIQHKKGRTIIMSTHHLDEAEVLSDRIAFLERGGLKCCGTPYHLKDQLGQGYKLTLTKKLHNGDSKQIDKADLKAFVQAHVPEARLKEAQGSDLVYLLPPFSSNNASSYRSLLTALDSNLDSLQLGCYGISDTTLEEVFLHLTHGSTDAAGDELPTISETVSDTESINSYPESEEGNESDTVCFTGAPTVSGVKLAWQQMTAILIKRFHHSRRDWKGLLSQILLPVLFVVFAMGLGVIKSDLRHYPELELSPAIYKIGQSYSFFSNPNSSKLVDAMVSFPGLDNACLQKSNDQVCTRSTGAWTTANGTKKFSTCKCVQGKEGCGARGYVPPHKQIPSSQIVYNVTDLNVENYLVATADDYIRNRYGGYDFGLPLPQNLKMDVKTVPLNRTLSKVWFNPEGHHTMPAYLSSMNNFILRANLPADKDPSQYAISVSSHPYFGRPDDEDSIVQGMLQIMVALCILAGYSITTASFAIYEVNEYHSGSKRLQHIAGVSEPFYWIVNFFYDMIMYLIPVALTVGVIAAFQVPAFTDRQNLGAVAMLLVLFGFSTFPWMYLLSSVFKDAEMAFITFVCINLFLSVNTIIPTSILYFMRQITYQNTEGLKVIFDRLSYAFLIFPQFNFGNGLLALARTNIEVQILSGYGIDAYKDPFSTDALGWMMISSFIQGVVFFTLRLLWNKYIVRKVSPLILRRKSVHVAPNVDEDEDVAAEHLRVSSGAASSDVLQVNQLTKVYQHLNKKVPAVKKLSLGVPAGECFGLLGVNGAGKTTTFKMLTGDVSPTDGTAQIRDRNGRLVDIMECRNQGINIGYCPQEDALDDLLTGEEHLYFYARLHGISKRDIPGVVNYLLRRVELNRYRDTIADRYSCGTRRKLSTALALVGHPQILLLDEPSSGMDPRTKRQLWKIITEEVKGKCAVVLTSHSMEECEALCGRLAIMVKGQFQCLGSLQHIKNRFGSGFTVKMYMAKASSDADAITRFMQSRFPSTYLKEQHSAMVEYHVPVAPGGVADIFGQLESSKEHLEIQHFSVSQTTLDEVFINFAMETIGMETLPIEDECDDDSSLNDVET